MFDFRPAVTEDLPQIKSMYQEIIKKLDEDNIQFWDDFYPCEFFEADIRNNRLYVLLDENRIISAFALNVINEGENAVEWSYQGDRVLYLDRFGVNVKYAGLGIGSFMLQKAKETAKVMGAECLRLFVVDFNTPAINLYIKNGFSRACGIFNNVIDDDLVLHEYGYEIKL